MTGTETGDSLSGRIVRGAGWVVAMRVAVRGLGILSTLILARLLVPDDYGLIAIATLMATAIEILSSFNFELWLVRHKDPQPPDYNTVWSLGLIRATVTATIMAALAVPVGAFFAEPRLGDVVYVLAFAIWIGALGNVGVVDFQRNLQFDKDFRYFAGSKLVAFVITVSCAVIWRNYWALVAGIAAGHVVKLALSYTMHPYRPRWSLAQWRPAFEFSKWLLAGNLLTFAYKRSDTFILGKLMATQTVGIYSMAFTLANLASTEVVTPIRRVLLPGYAKLLGDHDALCNGFVNGFAVIVMLGLPIAAGIGLTADPLVRVALGEKWLATIPVVQVLSVYALASIGLANQGPLLVALGRTRLMSMLMLLAAVVLIPAFWFAVAHGGIRGGAIAASGANMFLFLTSLGATLRVLKLPLRRVLAPVWRSVLAAATMALALSALQRTDWAVAQHPGVLLSCCISAGAALYALTLLGCWLASGRPAGSEQLLNNYVRARAKA